MNMAQRFIVDTFCECADNSTLKLVECVYWTHFYHFQDGSYLKSEFRKGIGERMEAITREQYEQAKAEALSRP